MSEQPQEQPDLAVRIARAIDFAPDIVHAGDHHKAWVVDQMVRALTGCYEGQGESGGYRRFVTEFDAKWGAGTWKEGVAP
jgi:hypothetical protein